MWWVAATLKGRCGPSKTAGEQGSLLLIASSVQEAISADGDPAAKDFVS
jgi:hypothetical protein